MTSAPGLKQIIEDYVAATNAWQPSGASSRGFHEHDTELGNRSAAAVDARMAYIRRTLDELHQLDASSLSGNDPYDLDLLRRRLQWELTEHEHVRYWRRHPGGYLGTIGSALNGLVIRDFAPLDERLRSLVSRLRKVPQLLAQAKENLAEPLRPHVETSIEQAAGMRALFLRDLPDAASKSSDVGLKQEFDEANRGALAAVDDFAAWLKADLTARASDDFAWGADTMARLLSETDSIDEPLQDLIARGEDDLRAHQQALRDVAAKIDPQGAPAYVVDAVAREHGEPDRLLGDVAALLEDLRQFSIDAKLCTMPTDVRIAVTETPGFARMTTQAACSTPGPFETRAKEAYYYVTLPDESWPAERTESYM
jgi:uncharacterized protein (DUF885 family)